MINQKISTAGEGKSSSQAKQILKEEDVLLWDSFRGGNESSFIRIYDGYFEILYAYGWRFSKDENLIKDAIQDLFIDLRKNRRTLGATNSIKFYLFKCLKRKIIKENGKFYHQLESLDPGHHFNFQFSHEQYLIDRQITEEKEAMLNAAIGQLSPRQKEVIYYFFYEGLNYGQIQEIMNLDNIKSVRNLIYKALGFLRMILK